MQNGHRRYPAEFRAEAVRLFRSSGKTLKVQAEDLGVSLETLRAWVKRADVDERHRPGITTEEREELRRLRRENRTLKMERDLLKKAAAFFARDTDPTR